MQLTFNSLCSRLPQVECFKKTVQTNDIRQVIVEVSRGETDPLVAKPLLDSRVPS